MKAQLDINKIALYIRAVITDSEIDIGDQFPPLAE